MKIKPFILFLCLSSGVFAVEQPRGLSTDNRIKVVPYEENNIVSIVGNTFVATQIVFNPSEKILSIQGGDAVAWSTTVDKNVPNLLTVKPTITGSNTNMTVVTQTDSGKQRLYYFHLVSQSHTTGDRDVKPDSRVTYAVHFIYPQDVIEKAVAEQNFQQQQASATLSASQQPSQYNWNYAFHGDKSIVPRHVFDDGKFTYLELRENQDIPAIFAVKDQSGEESVVNYRRSDNYLIIQQVAPQFTLRNGKHSVATLFNEKRIKQLQKNTR